MRNLIPILALLIAAQALSAREAIVRTAVGQSFFGRVRFIKDAVVVVNSAQNLVVSIPGTNIANILLNDPPASEIEDTQFGVLPSDWQERDIGSVEAAGSARVRGRNFTVRGAGLGADQELDSFHYVYRSVRGDQEIVARVTTVQQTGPGAKAGLTMRESVGEYSPYVSLLVSPERGGAFQVRASNGRTPQISLQPDIRAPYWLKLRRRGHEFSGFKSRNGRQWTLVQQQQIPMGDDYYVGLCVASGRSARLNWTAFDGVRAAKKLRNEEFTPRVELTSGSSIAGWPLEMDARELRFEGGRRIVSVPPAHIARIIYQPLGTDLTWKARVSRPGVWMQNGDFFDGELQSLTKEDLRVSSVLYGVRAFDIADEVAALVLRNSSGARAAVEVEGVDGSLLAGSSATFENGELVLKEPALGRLHLPAAAIREVRFPR